MKRPLLFASLGALALVPVTLALTSAGSAPLPPCANLFPHEPMVVYEISGYGFGGLFDQSLTLYGDGSARLSRATLDGVGSSARLVYVGQDAAVALARDLVQLGAREQCDQQAIVADLPLSTLTVIGPTTDARAHTYSWFIPITPESQSIELRLQGFIATYFSGF